MSTRQDILATLDEYADAYCAKDLARLMNVFRTGGDVSLIGTGTDELCTGHAAISAVFERNFRDATATQFKWGWTDVALHGDSATVATALDIHLTVDGSAMQIPIRWTVSMVLTAQGWKWVHRHASAAASAQDDGAAYPVESA